LLLGLKGEVKMDKSKRELRDEKRELQDELRGDKKAQKQLQRAEREADKKQKEAEDLELYGQNVLTESLNITPVLFFQKGYAKFGGSTEFEKLLAVDVMATNLTKKTGLGRGVGAVFTLGWSLATPSTRGNVIVTILTDKKARTFDLLPNAVWLKASQRIEQVGKALIRANDEQANKSGPEVSPDFGDAIQKLVTLHQSGALTDDEFTKAKAKLLQ
jgi:hypothetical protein